MGRAFAANGDKMILERNIENFLEKGGFEEFALCGEKRVMV